MPRTCDRSPRNLQMAKKKKKKKNEKGEKTKAEIQAARNKVTKIN